MMMIKMINFHETCKYPPCLVILLCEKMIRFGKWSVSHLNIYNVHYLSCNVNRMMSEDKDDEDEKKKK